MEGNLDKSGASASRSTRCCHNHIHKSSWQKRGPKTLADRAKSTAKPLSTGSPARVMWPRVVDHLFRVSTPRRNCQSALFTSPILIRRCFVFRLRPVQKFIFLVRDLGAINQPASGLKRNVALKSRTSTGKKLDTAFVAGSFSELC